ncbi:DNA cytosine-5-methyltransferase [Corynebacterium variabile DSM 44702]|uniref:DNA (cytosine-5-)-methyltransferase n=2 Tax=Corynebacterium variabile TaxID=1727 RepID=G0HHS8_CORVD|nr:DNA cytosine-5-methyltransferase [Corynebacterium variabile DSM 44702]
MSRFGNRRQRPPSCKAEPHGKADQRRRSCPHSRHAACVPQRHVYTACMTLTKGPIVWSFFSGAMGLDLGLEETGWEPSLAVEIDARFCETISRNKPDLDIINSDVAELTGEALFARTGENQVDLMVGGPPCQSFSTGGKRAALSDSRGNAIFEYLRLISEVRPRAFVLENVANLVTAAIKHRPIAERPGKSWNLSSYSEANRPLKLDGISHDGPPPLTEDELSGSAIRHLLSTAVADLGYQVKFQVLDASDFGAPQRRLRFVMIGMRDNTPPDFIGPTHGVEQTPQVTVRDAIGDLVDNPGPGALYSERTRRYFSLVPEGGNWRSLPEDVAREAMGERSYNAGGGKTGFFRRLQWEAQSPTITGKPNRKGSAMCHPSDTRPLSVHECARIQGFPDDWEIVGSVADQYTQIGNAVPVALGRAIGMTLNEPALPKSEIDHDQMLNVAVDRLRASARNKRSRRKTGV